MKRYWGLCRGALLDSVNFRGHYLFTFLGNILFITLIYFLWTAIFGSSSKVINGMTFNDTFMYLTLAASTATLLKTWCDWDMSRAMLNGNIVLQLLRPLDYQLYKIFDNLGFVISNFVIIFIPSFVLIVFVFDGGISIGINIVFFIAAIILAYLINNSIDFMIGSVSFYTESIWGISTTKDVIVLLLSGSVVPLPFFPEALRNIIELLPFQAIYNLPLQILTNKSLQVIDYLRYLGIQAIWAVLLIAASRLVFKKASKLITVNGG